ncbi:helix-turn-helix domain-containing protein [Kribbella sp. NPDC056345]|uniref:helix-turn-helix domain-containing protein n=1 Tax=Kribbella sp. NPDC056345 TaxID=3345789 RepID=UPI0035D63EA6
MAGRPEAPLAADALPHLVPLADEMRKAREAAGLRLADLATVMGYQPSYLSRVCNARRMPHKDLVLSWAKGCGVAQLDDWTRMWETVKAADVEYKRQQREAKKNPKSVPTSASPTSAAVTTPAPEQVLPAPLAIAGRVASAAPDRPQVVPSGIRATTTTVTRTRSPGAFRPANSRVLKVDGFSQPRRLAAERERAAMDLAPDGPSVSLSQMLQRSDTPEMLATAIRVLAGRAGYSSLREMAAVSGISKSTLQHWLSAKMRPGRLDELVIALGATPRETRLFAQCMERAWSRRMPVLEPGVPVYSPRLSSRYGAPIYLVEITLFDRDVVSGMVRTQQWPEHVQGITVGPFHDMRPSTVAPLPPLARKHAFEIAIWTGTREVPTDSKISLEFQLSTANGEVFTHVVTVMIPASSVWTFEVAGAEAPKDDRHPLPEPHPEITEAPEASQIEASSGMSATDDSRGKHRRPREKKGVFKALLSLVTTDLKG